MKGLLKYFVDVLRHKWYVLVFGLKIGGIPLWRLLIHDWSKFLSIESGAYVKRFVYGNCPKAEWQVAWEHHTNHNPHHREYWMQNGEPILMPEAYIREMVADWMATGKSSSTADDLQSWVSKTAPKMKLHPQTIVILERILNEHQIVWPSSVC